MTANRSPVGVGILGCGVISHAYLERLNTFDMIHVRACADVITERAQARADAHGVARACSPDELLADPDIDLVVNLTIPALHARLALDALAAGKSVYSEKPLSLTRDKAAAVLAAATDRGLRVGCAPDTFLGAGLQTCRRLIDEGVIGEPLAASAFLMGAGPEQWHQDPAFFYQAGAGPLFDMGVYYVTALVSLLGPVARVSGSARISRAERAIHSQPLKGQLIKVEVPTHVSATLDFAGGPVATLVTSFDVQGSALPNIEIYGTEGTLSVPDPNTFGGPVRVLRNATDGWADVALDPGFAEQARGIGVADLVLAMNEDRPHRASGELALHVLDIMESIYDASADGRYVTPATTCDRPAPLPAGWAGT